MKRIKNTNLVVIRRYQRSDWLPVCQLIQKTIKTFFRHEQSRATTNQMLQVFSAGNKELESRFDNKPMRVWVALKDQKIVGVIRGALENRIRQLYVDGRYQGQGIGSRLVHEYEKAAMRQGYAFIKVYSALTAIGFYTRLGFTKSTGIRNGRKGLRYQPMKKIL